MKRITVSLPDDLAEAIKAAAGGEGHVSAYIATALAEYGKRESLDEILVSWQAEAPVSDDVRRQASEELDQVGLTQRPAGERRMAG